MKRLASALTLLCVATLLSCGGGGESGFAVSGNVTFDGQPVTNGTIGFIPANQTGAKFRSVGADIVDGQYTIDAYEGPTQGSYEVMIYAERPSGRRIQADEGSSETVDEMVQYIPEMYNAATTLKVEIDGDRQDLDFALEKPPARGRR